MAECLPILRVRGLLRAGGCCEKGESVLCSVPQERQDCVSKSGYILLSESHTLPGKVNIIERTGEDSGVMEFEKSGDVFGCRSCIGDGQTGIKEHYKGLAWHFKTFVQGKSILGNTTHTTSRTTESRRPRTPG